MGLVCSSLDDPSSQLARQHAFLLFRRHHAAHSVPGVEGGCVWEKTGLSASTPRPWVSRPTDMGLGSNIGPSMGLVCAS
jgi:hypothetical protein